VGKSSKGREEEDALFIASEYQGIFLKSGKRKSCKRWKERLIVRKSFSNTYEFYSSNITSINSISRNNDTIIKIKKHHLLLKW
jgi:hypothetical protein